MNSTLTKIAFVFIAVCAAFFMNPVAEAQKVLDLSGTWKLNLERSHFGSGPRWAI